MGKANPISIIKDALGRTVEKKASPVRRALFGLTLIALTSACVGPKEPEPSRIPPSRIPTRAPTAVSTVDAQTIPHYSKYIREGVSIHLNGEPSFDKTPPQFPKTNVEAFEYSNTFKRTQIQLQNDVTVAIIEINTKQNFNYAEAVMRVYSNCVSLFALLSKDTSISQIPARFPKGNVAMTINNVAIDWKQNGSIDWPLAEFGDSDIKTLVDLTMNNERTVLPMNNAEAGFTSKSSSTNTTSKIGINLIAFPHSSAGLSANGIKLSQSEWTDMIMANEMAAYFFDYFKANQPHVYKFYVEKLLSDFGFPPDGNPKFEEHLAKRMKDFKITKEKARSDVINEALTTYLEQMYIMKVLKK